MGFEYQFFKDKMLSIKAVGGFDKELEMRILLEGKKIYYVEDAIIYDEKVQNTTDFKNQRTRWITAQINYLQLYFFKAVEQLIFKGNLDFFNKILQTMLLPRILLLGLLCINTLITMLSGNLLLSGISFGTTALLLVALLIAIPRHLLDRIRLVELLNLPVLFLKYAGSLMNMKAARKKFIHTPHGHLQ
jgi:cellulose synthase/poly-beta-1,6-N-acetylglucosamine synthase-like glycosyltransferase